MRKALLRIETLESIVVPATLTAAINPAADNAGAVAELVGLFNQANAAPDTTTINLYPNATYAFSAAADSADGGNALPTITAASKQSNAVTVNGNGATLTRAADAPGFRFFRAAGAGTVSLTLTNMTLSNGSTSASGGAVESIVAQFTADRVTFTGNAAGTNGGAAYFAHSGANGTTPAYTFTDCTLSGNKASGDGGAVSASFTDGHFVGTTVSGNTAGNGTGAIGVGFASTTFDGCTLSGNVGTGNGAVNDLGTVTMTGCTVSGNTSTKGAPGGVGASTVTVTASTIANNVGKSSVGSGGGLGGNTITVIDSTVVGNVAATGGAMRGGTVTVIDSTVTGNQSTFGIANAGGVEGGTVTLTGSVVAGNKNVEAGKPGEPDGNDIVDVEADSLTSGYDLIGVAPQNYSPAIGDRSGTAAAPLDPELGPLTNNGGPTQTRMPLAGSRVLDAGSPTPPSGVAADQRGLPRVSNGASDIGAVELQTGTEAAATPPPALTGTGEFAVGTDSGAGTATLYNPDGTTRFTAAPFGSTFTGGVRTATADFNGDGVADLVVGTGPGGPTQVQVLDGKDQHLIATVTPFEAAFTGGVYVAAGDLNGDGVPDLVVTPDQGGGPVVVVYDGAALAKGTASQVTRFYGIADPNFRGGARAAVGDTNGDGASDLVVAAGYGGGPRVAVFDGKSVPSGDPGRLFNDFFAFEQTLRNGVFIAVGDVTGSGEADIIAGGGPGGGPRVTAFSAADLIASGGGTLTPLANFFAGDPNNRAGVRVAVKDLDGDAKADLVTGPGTGAGGEVTMYLGKDIQPAGTPPVALSFTATPGFTGGVFVG